MHVAVSRQKLSLSRKSFCSLYSTTQSFLLRRHFALGRYIRGINVVFWKKTNANGKFKPNKYIENLWWETHLRPLKLMYYRAAEG